MQELFLYAAGAMFGSERQRERRRKLFWGAVAGRIFFVAYRRKMVYNRAEILRRWKLF